MELDAQQYTASGISAANRRRLEQLHRGSKGPVTVREAAHILGIDATTTARLLAHWCAHGWIRRVRRGLYVLVPLGAAGRVGVVADPWIFIARAFAPCYIGGWSACEHWDLTEQLFREAVVITSKPVRPRRGEIGGARYLARVIAPRQLFSSSTAGDSVTRQCSSASGSSSSGSVSRRRTCWRSASAQRLPDTLAWTRAARHAAGSSAAGGSSSTSGCPPADDRRPRTSGARTRVVTA